MASPSSNNQEEEEKKHSILHRWASSILLFLACLLIWIHVHPKHLRFTVENVIAPDFTISAVFNPLRNTDEDQLHATFLVSYSTYNLDHRVTIRYESIHTTVECNVQVLAFEPVKPFVQVEWMKRWFNLSVSAKNVTLLSPAADYLKKIKKPLDQVKVDVKMRAKASFVMPHWKTDHRELKVVCLGVMAHFSASNPFEKTRCKVEL